MIALCENEQQENKNHLISQQTDFRSNTQSRLNGQGSNGHSKQKRLTDLVNKHG